MDKTQTFYSVGGSVNWCSHYGKQFHRKVKNRTIIGSSNLTSRHTCRENSNPKRYNHANVKAVLLTTAKTRKQPKCSPAEEWIKICACMNIIHP